MGGRPMTNRDILRIHDLRAENPPVSLRKIAKIIGRHRSVVEYHLYPAMKVASQRRAERNRANKSEFSSPHTVDPCPANRAVPPDYVLAERDARLSKNPESITAWLMGDPCR